MGGGGGSGWGGCQGGCDRKIEVWGVNGLGGGELVRGGGGVRVGGSGWT